MLLLEPLNQRDVPGYLHSTTEQARHLIKAAATDNVFLQYDIYHMQIMQGDIVEGIRSNLDITGTSSFPASPAATSRSMASSICGTPSIA